MALSEIGGPDDGLSTGVCNILVSRLTVLVLRLAFNSRCIELL